LICIKAAMIGLNYSAGMSPASSKPRRTPLPLKLVYGQLVVAIAAFAFVPFSVLRSAHSGPVAPAISEGADEIGSDTAPPDAAQASNDPIARDEAIFGQSCAGCHQPTGQGIAGVFPPLAGSDFLMADADRSVRVVLQGLVGPITVNGVNYESAMPPLPLQDDEIAAVLSYVRQAWGNKGAPISAADVARVRAGPQPGS
jgi:mono/diheme cytochrome c family protein